MGNLAAALQAATLTNGPKCAIAMVMPQLDDADRELLSAWLAHESDPPHAVVARALKSEGHEVGAGAVSRHRKGDCSCSA